MSQENIELNAEEKSLIDSFERGEWTSVEPLHERLAEYRSYAQDAMHADQRIEVALFQRDLHVLQAEALAAGVPYKSFIAGILHRYATGKLIEKSEV